MPKQNGTPSLKWSLPSLSDQIAPRSILFSALWVDFPMIPGRSFRQSANMGGPNWRWQLATTSAFGYVVSSLRYYRLNVIAGLSYIGRYSVLTGKVQCRYLRGAYLCLIINIAIIGTRQFENWILNSDRSANRILFFRDFNWNGLNVPKSNQVIALTIGFHEAKCMKFCILSFGIIILYFTSYPRLVHNRVWFR